MAFTQFASNLGVEVKGKDSGAIGATMITMITVKIMIKILQQKNNDNKNEVRDIFQIRSDR